MIARGGWCSKEVARPFEVGVRIFATSPIRDWEVDLVSSFFELLYSLKGRQGCEERICWIPSKRRKFEVKSYYHVSSITTSFPFP
jgi:hypothetical protein